MAAIDARGFPYSPFAAIGGWPPRRSYRWFVYRFNRAQETLCTPPGNLSLNIHCHSWIWRARKAPAHDSR